MNKTKYRWVYIVPLASHTVSILRLFNINEVKLLILESSVNIVLVQFF